MHKNNNYITNKHHNISNNLNLKKFKFSIRQQTRLRIHKQSITYTNFMAQNWSENRNSKSIVCQRERGETFRFDGRGKQRTDWNSIWAFVLLFPLRSVFDFLVCSPFLQSFWCEKRNKAFISCGPVATLIIVKSWITFLITWITPSLCR